jgi:hypothetical protein
MTPSSSVPEVPHADSSQLWVRIKKLDDAGQPAAVEWLGHLVVLIDSV